MIFLCISATGAQRDGASLCDACFDNLQEGVPFNIVRTMCNLSHTKKYLISIECKCCLLTVLFAIPTAIALLQCTCVLGCGCPNSYSVKQKIMPSLQFKKRAPSLASAVDATTNLRIAHEVKKAPFNLMGSLSFAVQPMNKCPQARLHALDSER